MNLNQRTVTIKLTREELTDILLLCAYQNYPKWRELHEKLANQLAKADAKFIKEVATWTE